MRFALKKILDNFSFKRHVFSVICMYSSVCLANDCNTSQEMPTLKAKEEVSTPKNIQIITDFLYWTISESGSDVWSEVITSHGNASSDDLRAVDFGWDPGFRVGVDYKTNHDSWDTELTYTWFYTKGQDHVNSSPGTVHSSYTGGFLIDNTTGVGISGPSYQSAKIAWKVHFGMFDWDLGRRYQVTKSVSLRPFLGLKGGWIDQTIESTWFNPDLSSFPAALPFSVGYENLKNDFWGIGPVFGLDSKWCLYSKSQNFLNLLGDLSGAVMYGHWKFKDVYQNDIAQKIHVGSSPINGGATMIRFFMGLGWDIHFSQNRYQLSSKIGYEMQCWLDQLQYYSFTGGRLSNELTLQGGTLEFTFAF
jgi:hypothetical protein